MKRSNRHNRHNRIGLGTVELTVIIAGLALVAFFSISQLGSLVSDDIDQTAGGIGDPAQLVNHPRFTGEPYTPSDNGSFDDNNGGKKDKKVKDKKVKDKKVKDKKKYNKKRKR